MSSVFPYKAFFSYSHQVDNQLSPAVQIALQTFAKPWYRKRSFEVFRDETGLTMTPSLWKMIKEKLAVCEHFVLFASPESANSLWVGREVTWWLKNRSLETLHIILTDGFIQWNYDQDVLDHEKTNSLPKLLAQSLTNEPYYIDLRWARSQHELTLENSKFRTTIRHLSASLIGKTPEEVYSEEARVLRRNLMTAGVAIILLVLSFSLAIRGLISTRVQKKAADQRAMIAQARYLASESILQKENNPTLSMLLGLKSTYVTNKLGFSLETSHQALWDSLRLDEANGLALSGHRSISTYSFSEDGKWLVTGDNKGTVYIWDLKSSFTGPTNRQKVFLDHTVSVDEVAIHGGRKIVAMLSSDKFSNRKIRIENFAKNGSVAFDTISLPRPSNVKRLLFTPSGKRLSAVSQNGEFFLWELRVNGSIRLQPKKDHSLDGYRFVLSSDGRWCVGFPGKTDSTGPLLYWDLHEADPFKMVKSSSFPITAVPITQSENSGEWLLFQTGDKVLLWNVKKEPTEQEPIILSISHKKIKQFVASPDGRFFLIQLRNGKFLMCDTKVDPTSLEQISIEDRILKQPEINVALHPSGQEILFSKGRDYLIARRKNNEWLSYRRLDIPPEINPIRCITYSYDGQWIFISTFSNTLVYDSQNHNLQHVLSGSANFLGRKMLSSDGHFLIIIDGSRKKLWKISDLQKRETLSSYELRMTKEGGWRTYFNENLLQRWVGQTNSNGDILLMDLMAEPFKKRIQTLKNVSESPIQSVRFSGDSRWAIAIDENEAITHIDLSEPKMPITGNTYPSIGSTTKRKPKNVNSSYQSHSKPASSWSFHFSEIPVAHAEISPGGRWVAFVRRYGTNLELRPISNLHSVSSLGLHPKGISQIGFSGNDRWLISLGLGETFARLWRIGLPEKTTPVLLQGKGVALQGVRLDASGQWAVIFDTEGNCLLWKIDENNEIHGPFDLSGHTKKINGAVFSPDGNWLATFSDDNTARLWHLTNGNPGEVVHLLEGHISSISCATISADSRWLVTVDYDDANMRVWNLQSKKVAIVHDVLRSSGSMGVTNVTFSPNSRWLVTWGGTPNARLWNMSHTSPSRSMVLLRGDFSQGTEEDNSFAGFSPDSKWVVYNNNGKIFAKSLEPEKWDAHVKRFSGRNFTKKEWNIYFPNQPYQKLFKELGVLEK